VTAVGLVVRTCIALTCDVCGDGWADLDAEPHFAGRAEATRYARSAGWVVTGSRALCSDCTAVEACALAGHRWGRWVPAGPLPSVGGGTWRGRVRYCTACTAADWDPPVRQGASRRRAG
jgi:hypothetical protein